jgi:transcriptional regulator with XRE-family HTH domain
LGKRIRTLRLERGWTQDEFADLAGLHRTQVGAFETGRMNITIASLHLVAQTLGLRIGDLFIGVEDRPEPAAGKRQSSIVGHGSKGRKK